MTPDPKGIVLLAMQEGKLYHGKNELYNSVRCFLEKYGISSFPVTNTTCWSYIECFQGRTKTEGHLVTVGAVEASFDQFDQTYYSISDAGILIRPLVNAAIEFVWQSENKSRFNSMLKIFSMCNSPNEKKRQIAVYDVVKFILKVESKL